MAVATERAKGYRLDREGHGLVSAGMLLESPVRLDRFTHPRLEPELAVVLRREAAAGTEPEEAYLAVGGAFLAVAFLEADGASAGGVLVGERLLDLPVEGALGLYLDGELLGETPVEALGDPGERLARLAEEVDGLAAGTIVLLGSGAEPLEARAGTLELAGPGGSALIARIED
jgi:2-keto-4-pentenoate hydratase